MCKYRTPEFDGGDENKYQELVSYISDRLYICVQS